MTKAVVMASVVFAISYLMPSHLPVCTWVFMARNNISIGKKAEERIPSKFTRILPMQTHWNLNDYNISLHSVSIFCLIMWLLLSLPRLLIPTLEISTQLVGMLSEWRRQLYPLAPNNAAHQRNNKYVYALLILCETFINISIKQEA